MRSDVIMVTSGVKKGLCPSLFLHKLLKLIFQWLEPISMRSDVIKVTSGVKKELCPSQKYLHKL
jgi:hypothetical protein